jgi:hypothetical protein
LQDAPRAAKPLAVALGGFAALAGSLYLVLTLIHGAADADSLARSLRAEIRADQSGPACERIDEFEWHCEVRSAEAPSGYAYALIVDDSCWTARLIHRPIGVKLNTTQQPPEAEGCVRLADDLGVLG